MNTYIRRLIIVLLIFSIALFSKHVFAEAVFGFTGLPRIFIGVFEYGFMLFSVTIVLIVINKFSIPKILNLYGIKSEGIKRSLILFVIFLMVAIVLGILFLPHSPLNEYFLQFFGFANGNFELKILFEMSILDFATLVVLVFYAALIEELIFRGAMMNMLAPVDETSKNSANLLFTLIFTSILFDVWHLDFDIWNLTSRFVMGLIFGTMFLLSKRNVIGSSLYHGVQNVWVPVNGIYSKILWRILRV